jgi:hypothetical protein
MTALTCRFCSEPPALEPTTGATTQPPMCERHLDLMIFVEYMTGRNQEPTVEACLALLERAAANGGVLNITPADVERLLPELLENLGLDTAGAPIPAPVPGTGEGPKVKEAQ